MIIITMVEQLGQRVPQLRRPPRKVDDEDVVASLPHHVYIYIYIYICIYIYIERERDYIIVHNITIIQDIPPY